MSKPLEPNYWAENAEPTEYTRIADVEWRGQPWEFDMTRVYLHESGALFYAEDSGCSCPTPFENATSDNLHPINRMQDWYEHVTSRTVERDPEQEYQYPEPTPTSAFDQAETARRLIAAHLKAAK